jgi:acyl-CoA thioesterase FadM
VRTRAIRFEYELLRGDQLLAKGHTVHVCTDRGARPVTFPDWLKDAFKRALAV